MKGEEVTYNDKVDIIGMYFFGGVGCLGVKKWAVFVGLVSCWVVTKIVLSGLIFIWLIGTSLVGSRTIEYTYNQTGGNYIVNYKKQL